jgi:hypothetical protein
MRVGPASAATRERFVHELAVGWREVRSRRWVWMAILNASLFLMLYVAPFEVIGPIVSRESLGGPIAWGLISASFAAGMAVGGLGMMLIRLRRPMVVASAILLVTSVSPLLLAHAAPVGGSAGPTYWKAWRSGSGSRPGRRRYSVRFPPRCSHG